MRMLGNGLPGDLAEHSIKFRAGEVSIASKLDWLIELFWRLRVSRVVTLPQACTFATSIRVGQRVEMFRSSEGGVERESLSFWKIL